MSSGQTELTDEHLGAYVDEELDEARRTEVELALARDAAARKRLSAIRDVTMLVRLATHEGHPTSESSPGLARPSPQPEPTVATLRSPARMHRRPAWQDWRLAASFIGGALAFGLGMQLIGSDPGATGEWEQAVLNFHSEIARTTVDGATGLGRGFLDVHPEQIGTTLTPLLHHVVLLPDLSVHGYQPSGARLVTTDEGPLTFVLYEAAGKPTIGYSIFRKADSSATEPGLRTASGREHNLVGWSDGDFEFALTAEISNDALGLLAEAARQSISGSLEEL